MSIYSIPKRSSETLHETDLSIFDCGRTADERSPKVAYDDMDSLMYVRPFLTRDLGRTNARR